MKRSLFFATRPVRFSSFKASSSTTQFNDGEWEHAPRLSIWAHRVRTEPAFMWRLLGAGVAGAVVSWWTYQRLFQDTVPVSRRKRVLNFPRSVERAIGHMTFDSLIKKLPVVAAGDAHSVRVKRVLSALLGASPELVGPKGEWRFAVVNSREVNAFALPGARIIVNAGLLDFAATDDELAVVLAHEIAHVVARHGAEKMTGVAVGRLLRFVAGGFVNSEKMFAAFFDLAHNLPMSRVMESEADLIGLFIAAKAGVCPIWAAVFWSKMVARESAANRQGARWLSTHPPSKQRAVDLERHAKDAMPLFLKQRETLSWWEATFTATFTSCDACEHQLASAHQQQQSSK